MPFPETLTPSQRETGQRLFVRYSWVNSFATTFLMGNLLILYAIRNNLTPPVIAVIASFAHLTMPAMILGKQLIARDGIILTLTRCWWIRYGFAFLLILAPFAAASQRITTTMIVLGTLGFFIFRAMGLVGHSPLMGEITSSRDRGQFISGNTFRFNAMYLVSSLMLIVILRFWDDIRAFQLILLAGALSGFYAITLIRDVPESRRPMESARLPIKDSVRLIWTNPLYRKLLFAWCGLVISHVLVGPFAIIALKKGYGVPDHVAVVFTLLGVSGSMLSAYLVSGIAHHVGPRPIAIINSVGLFLVAAFWAFAPLTFVPVVVGLVFFLGGLFVTGGNISISHYFLSASKPSERIGLSLLLQIITGAAAGLAASVGGGGLLKILERGAGPGLALYNNYFRIILVVLIPMFFLRTRLERLKDWSIKGVLGLFFSFRDIRALFALSKIRDAAGYDDDMKQVQKLQDIGSTLSEDTLVGYLDSSRLTVRSRALSAFRRIDFGPRTVEALLNEIETGEFTTAWIAVEILGEHGEKKAIPAIRKTLQSEDVILRGKSMVALARLRDKKSFPEIERRFEESDNPRIVIHGGNALAYLGGDQNLMRMLQKAVVEALPEAVRDELLTAATKLCDCEEGFYAFLKEYNKNPRRGLVMLPDLVGDENAETWNHLLQATDDPDEDAMSLKQNLINEAEKSKSPFSETVKAFVQETRLYRLQPKLCYCLVLILSQGERGEL